MNKTMYNRYNDGKIKICKVCNSEMLLDDIDFHFKGCLDKYWICENCKTSCTEEIRYGQSFKEHWFNKDKNIYETVKHNNTIKK